MSRVFSLTQYDNSRLISLEAFVWKDYEQFEVVFQEMELARSVFNYLGSLRFYSFEFSFGSLPLTLAYFFFFSSSIYFSNSIPSKDGWSYIRSSDATNRQIQMQQRVRSILGKLLATSGLNGLSSGLGHGNASTTSGLTRTDDK